MNIRRLASRNLNNTVLAIVLLAVMLLLALVIGNRFFTLRNFRSMAGQIPEFGLLSLAIMAAMLTGGIDLSIVATANLSGIVAAMVMTRFIGPDMSGGAVVLVVAAAIAVGLMVAVFCGALNGLLITRVGIPAIIATLGTMALYDGIGILITSGRGIVGFPEPFQFLGNGSIGPVPMAFVIFAVTVVVFAIMLNRTQLGQSIKMIGANPIAARFAGLNIPLVLMKVYIMNGILAGISAMIMISRSNSAKSGYGSSYLLQSILIVVLGGTNPAGGFGSVSGVIMAIFILQFLGSGLNNLGFSPFAQEIIRGGMLLLVMVINFYTSRRAAGRK